METATLETLEIEIKHSASGAADEINKVATAIRALNDSLKGVVPKLTKLAGALNAIKGGRRDLTFNISDNSLHQTADTITNITQKIPKAEKSVAPLSKAFSAVGDAAKKAISPVTGFLRSLGRIAFYRLIRSMLKAVTQAFSEGLKNAYFFSQGIEGQGHRFAEAMDQIKSASTTMKNELGAAFLGLLTALMPVLLQLISLVTRAANAINQLMAAFTGTTYLKAKDVTQQWAENTANGAAAAKEWRNQLLGFDEINRLDEPNKGGGGGSTGLDPSQMFEETPIDEWVYKVKDAITWLQEHMELIRTIAIAIGAAIAAWKIGNVVANALGITGALSKILGIATAIAGAFMLVVGFCDAWKNGVNWDNLILMIGGTALVATGLAIAFGATAAAVGLLVGGIAMLVIGVKDWIENGELTTETFWLLEGAIAAVGIALGILIGWPAALVAALAAAGLAIYKYWEQIVGFINDCIEWIKGAFEWLDQVTSGTTSSDSSYYVVDDTFGVAFPGMAASGGQFDTGELFIAREAGPEMVGTIGGKTSVANNDQIVEGIREGVYEAVSAAMSGNSGATEVRVYLDSREIRAGQQRLARSMGV